MRRPNGRSRAWTMALVAGLLAMALASGCTVIRYVDGGGGGGGGGGGEVEPPVVDILIQANLRRSTGNLARDYQTILGFLLAGLEKKKVKVRHIGLAPMYRRHGGTVPLIYGKGAKNSQFDTIGQAIGFYTRDDGAEYLSDDAVVDGENLAALGMDLGTRAVYHPKTASPDSRAYYDPPEDGFIVLSLSAAPRRCNASEPDCKLDTKAPGKYFTAKNKGKAKWLSLPGGKSLPPSKIFHVSIATAEGIGYEQFANRCRSAPKFPKTRLDVMEPSDKKYFGPLAKQIGSNGGWAKQMSLCRAMSLNGKGMLLSLAGSIASSL